MLNFKIFFLSCPIVRGVLGDSDIPFRVGLLGVLYGLYDIIRLFEGGVIIIQHSFLSSRIITVNWMGRIDDS